MEFRQIKLLGLDQSLLQRSDRGKLSPLDRLVARMLMQRGPQVVGAQVLTTASSPSSSQRFDKTAASVFAQAHGKYYQANEMRNLFSTCHNAGDAPPGTISTTAAACLYNPIGSTVNLILCKVSAAYVSGTIGTGTVFHSVNMTATQTAPTGTAATGGVVNLSGGGAGQGQYFSTATVVAPKVTRPWFGLAPYLASSVVGFPQYIDDMEGEIVIPPGCSYQIQSIAAAGTSPLFAWGIVWEEVIAS